MQSSSTSFNNRNSSFDEFGAYGLDLDNAMDHDEFSPPLTITEDSSVIISRIPTTFPDNFMDFPVITLPEIDFSIALEDFEIENMFESPEEREKSFLSQQFSIDGADGWSLSSPVKSSDTTMDMSLNEASPTLPTDDMELDNHESLIHLVKAYGEAIDEEHIELAKAIMKCISEKVSPVGGVVERLLYYLFQSLDKQSGYLKQESSKNFLAAFKAFYQIFPYGKFAHSAANQAIIEAMPPGVEVIHIIDCDMGEGIQWSSMIEALGCQQREIRLTSIKWSEDDSDGDPSLWRFEETKRWLCDHARSFGLKLTVDNMELHDLATEIKNVKQKGGRREWLAFNCMVGLPHMGRMRSRRDVSKFLSVAKELLAYTANYDYNNMGIVTVGDGDTWVTSKSSSSFGSFLDGHLVHYQALLESIEWALPIHLGQSRTVLECLFVAPLISSISWSQEWEMSCCDRSELGLGLEGWRVSEQSLMEVEEMVRDGENLYGVRIEGENNNDMVLNWRGIPLVRVSCWRQTTGGLIFKSVLRPICETSC